MFDPNHCWQCRMVGWPNQPNERNQMNTLSTMLENRALDSLVQKMRKELQDNLTEKNVALTRAQAEVEEAQSAIDVFNKAFDLVAKKAPEFTKYFHVDSRTSISRQGHFIKAVSTTPNQVNPTLTCTCEAGAHGRECWAVKAIRENLRNGDSSFSINPDSYNRKVRPYSVSRRIPFSASRY